MYSQKKRSLNEIRQTKDSYYVVPKSVKKCLTEKVLEDYFNGNFGKSEVSQEMYANFINYLRLHRYKIIKE